jgi:hypothetical protein
MLSVKITSLFAAAMVFAFSGAAFSGVSEKKEARKHFNVATRLYEVEDYNGAATEFETSVKLYPTKNGYFNLANCYKALHRYEDALVAIEHLETRFAKEMDKTMRRKVNSLKSLINSLVGELTLYVDPLDAEVRLNGETLPKHRYGNPLKLGPGEYRIAASCEGYESYSGKVTVHSQKKKRLRISLTDEKGMLSVETDVEGAKVVVDGEPRGETPLSLSLAAGEHRLEVSREGYTAVSRTVEMISNQKTTVNLVLEAAEGAKMPTVETTRGSLFKTLKIAGIASSATTAVLSGVFYGLAAKKASDFKAYDEDYVNASTSQAVVAADADRLDAKQRTEQFAILGLAFGITAGVLGASTAVLFVLSNRRESQKEPSRVSLGNGNLTVSF